jgi:hypothetical protein
MPALCITRLISSGICSLARTAAIGRSTCDKNRRTHVGCQIAKTLSGHVSLRRHGGWR